MNDITLSRAQARKLVIAQGGLHRKEAFGRGKGAVLRALQQLTYVQIDTISVVARAHHHVLWSRVPNYQPSFLHRLQAVDQQVLEYWAHAAAYLPMEDFRYTLPIKRFFKDRKDRWPKPDAALMQQVYDRVKAEGPLMARDFEADRKRKGGGWWDWKPAKLALERLFLEGDLMIKERRGFQKVYDIQERTVPAHVETSYPSKTAYARHLIKQALQVHGLATTGEITYLRRDIKPEVQKQLNHLVDAGELVAARIRGIPNTLYYTTPELLSRSHRITTQLHILSPFDNVTIQRQRLGNLFNYQYQIECYVPKEKRVYGYFCLPILYQDRFIGRMDAKADRKRKVLEVLALYLDDERWLHKVDPALWARSLRAFAAFNGCEEVRIRHSHPGALRALLGTALLRT